MAFIGESKKDKYHPWKLYVCLDLKECEMLIDAIGKSVSRRLRTYEYYKDVVEGGEATEKQQDKYFEAQENYETIISVHETVMSYIKAKK